MRTIATLAAFAFADLALAAAPVAATAPTAAATATAPAPALVEFKPFEVKTFEPKAMEVGGDLEIKTKEVGGTDLDRKLASRKAKTADESSVMRAPAKPAIMEAAEAEAAAEAAAPAAPATKDNAGSR